MLYQPTRPVRHLTLLKQAAALRDAAVAASWDRRRDGALHDGLRPDELSELGLRKSEVGRFEYLLKEPTSK